MIQSYLSIFYDGYEKFNFFFSVSGGHKVNATCSLRTGSYDPSQLATCKAIYPFTDGQFKQVWNLKNADFEVKISNYSIADRKH